MRFAVLALVCSFAALAQFQPVHISNDGTVVEFLTEGSLRNSGKSPTCCRLYRTLGTGFAEVVSPLADSLVAATREAAQFQTVRYRSAADGLYRYWVRGDGSSPFQSALFKDGQRVTLPADGHLTVDPTGTWALLLEGSRTDLGFPSGYRIRLSDMSAQRLEGSLQASITSTGTVLRRGALDVMEIVPVSGSSRFVPTGFAFGGLQSPNGRFLVISRYGRSAVEAEVVTFDLETNRQAVNGTVAGQRTQAGSTVGTQGLYFSADSRFLLAEDAERTYFGVAGAIGNVSINPMDRVYRDVIFSSNGGIMVGQTPDGGLYRIDLEVSAPREVLRPFPILRNLFTRFVPGSLRELVCPGCGGSPLNPPIPLRPGFAGLEVYYAGLAVPISGRTAEGLQVQIPWEVTPDTNEFIVIDDTTHPFYFESAARVRTFGRLSDILYLPLSEGTGVAGLSVFQEPLRSNLGVVVHQDWRGYVKEQDPARSGEVLHVYMIGLGDVTNRPATGAPGNTNPLSTAVAPLPCDWSSPGYRSNPPRGPAEVLFAGLSPQFPGVYQVEVRVPQVSRPEWLRLACPSNAVPIAVRP